MQNLQRIVCPQYSLISQLSAWARHLHLLRSHCIIRNKTLLTQKFNAFFLLPVHRPRVPHGDQRARERTREVHEVADEGGDDADGRAGEHVLHVVAVVFQSGDCDPGCQENWGEGEGEAEEAGGDEGGAREAGGECEGACLGVWRDGQECE